MIIITQATIERREPPMGGALRLQAAWLDGRQFAYEINRRGIFVTGFGPRSPRLRRMAVHHLEMVVHDDVWTLLVRLRFHVLRRAVSDVRFLFAWRTPPTLPLVDDEVGTAFGVAPHPEVAAFLRELGYRVNERRWSDAIVVAPAPAA